MTGGKTLTALVATLMLVSSALAGFAGQVQRQESGDRPVLRFGLNAADLATLDPHFASGTQDRTVVDMVFNGLVRFKPGNSAEIEAGSGDRDPDNRRWSTGSRSGPLPCAKGSCVSPVPAPKRTS